MSRLILIAALTLSLSPAQAQQDPRAADPDSKEDGLSLMEEGARLFMRGILQDMEPALRDLRGLADEMRPALRSFSRQMGPALRDLIDKVEDWSVYHPPEMLPNGDIILRRKTPDELTLPKDGDEIEL